MTVAKHLSGKHDQVDHGLWAKGVDPKDAPFVRKERQITEAVPLDFAGLASYRQGATPIDDLEVARQFLAQDYNRYRTREMDRMRQKWEAKNPGDEWTIAKVEAELPQLAVEVMRDDGLIQAKRDELGSANPEQNLSDVFTHEWTGKDGRTFRSVVGSVYVSNGRATVDGTHQLVKEDGSTTTAGTWQRTVNGQDQSVYNARQVVRDEFRNAGIAGTFNDLNESSYIAGGVTSVSVTAADLRGSYSSKDSLSGPMVWALQGFDWASGSAGREVQNSLTKYVQSSEFRALPEPIQNSVARVESRVRAGRDGDYPTPREIATLGMLPGEKWWPGLAIMNHGGRTAQSHRRARTPGTAPGWRGVKRYDNPDGLRVTDGQVLSYQARQAVQNDPEMMAAVRRAFGTAAASRSGSTAASRSEAARRSWETRRANMAARELQEVQRLAAIGGAA